MKSGFNVATRLGFVYAVRVLVVLAFLTTLFVSVQVDNTLRPHRKISSGTVLAKWKIAYQPVELLTQDGIHLSAWYTPPKNGAVILVAHSYADHRLDARTASCYNTFTSTFRSIGNDRQPVKNTASFSGYDLAG